MYIFSACITLSTLSAVEQGARKMQWNVKKRKDKEKFVVAACRLPTSLCNCDINTLEAHTHKAIGTHNTTPDTHRQTHSPAHLHLKYLLRSFSANTSSGTERSLLKNKTHPEDQHWVEAELTGTHTSHNITSHTTSNEHHPHHIQSTSDTTTTTTTPTSICPSQQPPFASFVRNHNNASHGQFHTKQKKAKKIMQLIWEII